MEGSDSSAPRRPSAAGPMPRPSSAAAPKRRSAASPAPCSCRWPKKAGSTAPSPRAWFHATLSRCLRKRPRPTASCSAARTPPCSPPPPLTRPRRSAPPSARSSGRKSISWIPRRPRLKSSSAASPMKGWPTRRPGARGASAFSSPTTRSGSPARAACSST